MPVSRPSGRLAARTAPGRPRAKTGVAGRHEQPFPTQGRAGAEMARFVCTGLQPNSHLGGSKRLSRVKEEAVSPKPLGEDLFHHLPMDVSQPIVPPLEFIGQLFVV